MVKNGGAPIVIDEMPLHDMIRQRLNQHADKIAIVSSMS